MEVNCLGTDAEKVFCRQNSVEAMPKLVLFTGEEKLEFEENGRNIPKFQKFFDVHRSVFPAGE